MNVQVMKFGGSSLANEKLILSAAKRIVRVTKRGVRPVVVVSAQGDTTDALVAQAETLDPDARGPELDTLLATGEQASTALMAIALRRLGEDPVPLTGWQAGIETDQRFNRARITDLKPRRLQQIIERGSIPIVAGFQGSTEDGIITTLGRGGSDTTAVALAAALKAERCLIYTDVEGVYTADPRLVPQAQRIPRLNCKEMLEMARQGAKVLHLRAVELAHRYNVTIEVRSSFNDGEGTIIEGGKGMETGRVVTAIAHDDDLGRLTLRGVKDQPGIAARIFSVLSEADVNVDMIAQSTGSDGRNDVSFSVKKPDLRRTLNLIENIASELDARSVSVDENAAKISIIGVGMAEAPGVAAKVFETIATQGVNIEMIGTSDISITCLIETEAVPSVVRALHTAFALDQSLNSETARADAQ